MITTETQRFSNSFGILLNREMNCVYRVSTIFLQSFNF